MPASARLSPYVPRLAIEWLRDHPRMRHSQVAGSLAFVDISGFTNLTERLSRKGKVGAEEMNQILNSCFTEFLSSAYDYGAGVIKWGGDAVLLLFEGEQHEARSARAAFEMQRTMRRVGRIRTGSGAVTLRMSIGIHSGDFDFFLVGDLHRELVITGPAATQTVETESRADAGEIALSPATASALDPRDLGEPKGPAVLLRRGPQVVGERGGWVEGVEDLDMPSCVPIAVREHLLAGGGEPEHRPLTAAFIHFMGVDELLASDGPEVLADALDETISAVERIALDHGVAFFDTDVYQSGGKIMLIGGAPTSTGADEERMLRAMRAVMDEELPLALRIGVNRGRIFVGDFGPDYRRTYTVTGDAVNLAARLMAKAEPGQILATGDVLTRSRTAFQTVPLEPFQAKGKSEPVHAFLVDGVQAREERAGAAPLVGRARELEVLLEAFAAANEHSGRLVEVVGEPGLGKSRLIEELRARAAPVHAHSAQCDEYEASVPYFAFRRLLRELLELDAGGAEGGAEELHARVAADASHLLPLLPLIAVPVGIELADTPETKLLEERFRKARLEEAVRELMGILLLQPTLLVFEDAHWMDDASADLLRALISGLEERPWLVVVARRNQPSGFTAPEEAAAAVLALEPLGAEQAAELVHAATEETPLPPHEVSALAERAGGNPFFLTELLAAARSGELAELPDSVEALMLAEIDRLPPFDRHVLRCAAVAGASFTEDLVAASLDEPPDPGVWRRLAEYLDEQPDGQLRFRHALVRDAAYEGLPYRRRRELHERVGMTIETGSRRPDDEAALLSLHFFQARDFERAWRYSGIAGQGAESIYANVDAAAFFERALAAAKHVSGLPSAETARVWERLGDVRVRLGAFQAAGEAFRAARKQTPADPAEEARLLRKEALVPWRLGRLSQTFRWLQRGLRATQGTSDMEAGRERARLSVWCGIVRQRQGRMLEAMKWCRQAIAEAQEFDAPDALAHAYDTLDMVYISTGRLDETVHAPLALEIYERLGDAYRQGLVLNNMGVCRHLQGRWDEAVDCYERARDAWERCGDRWAASFAEVNMGEVLSDQGQLEEAEPQFRAALRIAKASHSDARVADVCVHLGRLLGRAGRFDEAHELFADARRQYVADGNQSELLAVDARIAECFVLEGKASRALSEAEAAIERAGSSEGVFVLISMLERIRGWALLQLGRLDDAATALDRSLTEARSKGADYELALALDAAVVVRLLAGDRADELSAERETIFESLGVVSTPGIPQHAR